METIPSKVKTSPSWLTISLAAERQNTAIKLSIVFCNTSQTTQEFDFSNRAHKAELLGLLIEDIAGQRVMPKHNLLIKPLQPDPDRHILDGGAILLYELGGTVVEDKWLEFPGALFKLEQNETYHIRFRYAGILSNSIILTT